MADEKKASQKVIYLGNDSNFFQNIIQRFNSNYDKIEWEFPIFAISDKDQPHKYYLEVLDSFPTIIYLDFCSHPALVSTLSEYMSRDPYFKNIPLIGLVDNKEDVVPLQGTGLDFVFVKGGEFHDIIYAPLNIVLPKVVIKPDFARGEMSQEVQLIDDFRISFIAPTYLHVEGNFYLEEESEILFKTNLPKKNVPSEFVQVKNRADFNLYYDYNYSYELDLKFVDPPGPIEEEDLSDVTDENVRRMRIKAAEDRKKEIMADHGALLKSSQKKHKEWVLDRVDDNVPKKTKLLIVDESMRIFRDNPEINLSSSPYMFRCQTRFADQLKDIHRMRPSIIAYQCISEFGPEDEEHFSRALKAIKQGNNEDIEAEESLDSRQKLTLLYDTIPEREKQEMNFMGNLIQFVKNMNNYSPIIIFFRCYFQTSKSLQDIFLYPMIVTHSESLSLDVCQNLAKIFEEKQNQKMKKLIKAKVAQLKAQDPQRYRKLTEKDFEESKYFIKGNKDLAYGSIKLPITLTLLSESEVEFQTEVLLPMKTYRLDFPIDMSVHLVPIEEGKDYLEEKGMKSYRGVIHSISETDKKFLRQQVNEIFFEPLNEKRQKEKEDFAELNQRVEIERESKGSEDSSDEVEE